MELEKLPDEIIYWILLRLPAESLLRFRTMSKLYRKTIDDPVFARSQYSLMGDKDPNLIFRYDEYSNLRQLQVDGAFLRPLPGHRGIATPGELLCSTNGYLLFSLPRFLSDEDKISLINPLRREIIVLSTPEPKDTWINAYTLAFNRSMEEYKIVCLFTRETNETNGAEVYSSKTKSWKEIKNFPECLVYSPSAFLNASIHWLSYYDGDDRLLSFDFETEEFRFHSTRLMLDIIPALVELGGYLVFGEKYKFWGCTPLHKVRTLIENEWPIMDRIDIDPQVFHRSICEVFYYLSADGLELRSSKYLIEPNANPKLMENCHRCKRNLLSLKNF